MIRSRVVSAIVAVAATVGMLSISASPASANFPLPPGGECANQVSWSVPASGKVKITWKTTCSRGVFQIEHGITVERSGHVLYAGNKGCISYSLIKSCARSVTVNDPSGSQKFETLDRLYIRYSPYSGASLSRKDYDAFSH